MISLSTLTLLLSSKIKLDPVFRSAFSLLNTTGESFSSSILILASFQSLLVFIPNYKIPF